MVEKKNSSYNNGVLSELADRMISTSNLNARVSKNVTIAEKTEKKMIFPLCMGMTIFIVTVSGT